MASRRVEWLDSLRGVAMLTVILGHVASMSKTMDTLIYSFHMPLFFMISGALFKVEKYASLKECVIDKAKKLLVPYCWLYAINIPFWYLNKKVLGDSEAGLGSIVLGFLTGNQAISSMASGALWFLPCLFLISVLFWWLADLDRRGKVKLEGSMVVVFLLGVYLCTFYHEPAIWHWATVPMATVFYYIGFVFFRNRDKILDALGLNETTGKFALVAIVILAIGVWAAFANGKISMHSNRYNIIALAFVSSTAISLGLAMCLMKLPVMKLFDYAGKNSIILFGFHIGVLRFLENFGPTAPFADHYSMLTGFVVFLLLIPISMFVNRFCPFIVGKKRPQKQK